MATPTADSYTITTGTTTVAVGRKAWPSWRRAMRPLEWVQINGAGTNVLNDVVRDLDASYNPNHPGNSPWRGATGPDAIFSAWNGCGYRYDVSEMWTALHGGHGDYGGNGGYRIRFNVDAPAWELFGYQTGEVGRTALGFDGVNEHLYTDGRPRGLHIHDHHVYVPGVGYMMVGGNSPWSASYTSASRRAWHMAEDGTYTLRATHASQLGADHQAAVYDTDDGVVWHFSDAGSPGLSLYDPSDDSFAAVAATTGYDHTSTARYDPDRSLIVLFARNGTGPMVRVWPKSGEKTVGSAYVPGTFTGTVPNGTALMGPAVDYVPTAQKWVMWNNGGAYDATDFYVLTPPSVGSNYQTGTWAWSRLQPAAYNTVTPSAKQANGTLGRFRYDPYLECCLLVNAIDEPVYAFSLSPGDL